MSKIKKQQTGRRSRRPSPATCYAYRELRVGDKILRTDEAFGIGLTTWEKAWRRTGAAGQYYTHQDHAPHRRRHNKEVSDGGPLTPKSKPNANPPFAGPTG